MQLAGGVQPTSGSVTWLVYKSNTQYGTYALADQFLGSGVVTDGYVSSGTINVALDDDTYYLFGVVVRGAHGVTVLQGGSPSPASFGVSLGGFSDIAGVPPTINDMLTVGPGTLGDDVALQVQSALPAD